MKNLKTILFTACAMVSAVGIFSLTVNDSSLESLRADAKLPAGVKCVVHENSDCLSGSTGNIYTGYKAGTIGG